MPDRLRLPVGSRSPGAVPAGACRGSVARWKKYESDLGKLFAALPIRHEEQPVSE